MSLASLRIGSTDREGKVRYATGWFWVVARFHCNLLYPASGVWLAIPWVRSLVPQAASRAPRSDTGAAAYTGPERRVVPAYGYANDGWGWGSALLWIVLIVAIVC